MPVNIANAKKPLDTKKDAALLAKHFKVSVDTVMKGYVPQEYSFSFKTPTVYIVAGRANGPLEAEVYADANDSDSGDYENLITISNSQNMVVAADLSKVMTNFFDNTLKSYNLGVKVKADIDKKLKKIIKEASEEFSYVLDEIEERSHS